MCSTPIEPKLFAEFENFKNFPIYSAAPSMTSLTIEDHSAIGRLLRAFAEFEDCLFLFICALSKLNESQGDAILSKNGYAQMLKIARQLAGFRDDAASKVWDAVFTPGLARITDVRNAITHGVYLGKSTDGGIVFLTNGSVGSTPKDYGNVSYTLHPHSLIAMAASLENHLPSVIAAFQIGPLRDRRYKLHPLPHPKAPPPPPHAKRRPPRLPSTGQS